MKVLIVNGGAAAGACGEAAARAEALLRERGAEPVLFWPVYTKDLACSGCGACRGAGMCVADPRGGAFVRAAADCGALLLIAPTGLLGPGIQAKNLLERAAVLTKRMKSDPFAGKRAAVFPVGRRAESGAAQLGKLLAALGLRVKGPGGSGEALPRLTELLIETEENV